MVLVFQRVHWNYVKSECAAVVVVASGMQRDVENARVCAVGGCACKLRWRGGDGVVVSWGVSVGVAVNVSVNGNVSVSAIVSVSVNVSVSISGSVSVTVSVTVNITVSVAVKTTVSVTVNISVSVTVSIIVSLSVNLKRYCRWGQHTTAQRLLFLRATHLPLPPPPPLLSSLFRRCDDRPRAEHGRLYQ